MIDQLEELKGVWKNVKQKTLPGSIDTTAIIIAARKRKLGTLKIKVLNILVLVLTLIGIGLFFFYVAKFNDPLSHIGSALMMGSLTLRIIIECYCIYLSLQIDLSKASIDTNKSFLEFYKFRKLIHGPVTITILILYTVGFYMLTPEFSLFFSFRMMVLIDLSYIVGASIVAFAIRRAIRNEMMHLSEIRKLQEQMIQQ
jgi:hypothetical protein